ncbi:MAG: FAD-dependent oxidoreductase, partial [Cyanobacteria bacterium]|nr:FAD-dependent oxidoreductase [Cyanobacteriota bacterium]
EMIENFFKPFMGGIFLDRSLETSSRMFEFVFRMFSLGDTTLPAQGMEAIPKELAKGLPENSIRLNTRVDAVSPGVVRLDYANASEEVLNSPYIVVATNPMECHRLLPAVEIPPCRDVSVFYYTMATPPFKEPMLILNGDEPGPINNLCILSQVAPGYAPKGQSLLSVTVLGMCDDEVEIEKKVRLQLKDWYGSSADTWRYLKKVSVKEAIPHAIGGKSDLKPRSLEFKNGIWVCGDHQDTASINGAMASGRRVAEAIIAKVSPKSLSSVSGKS